MLILAVILKVSLHKLFSVLDCTLSVSPFKRLQSRTHPCLQYLSLEYEKIQRYICNFKSICLQSITVYLKFICKVTHSVTIIQLNTSNLGPVELSQLANLQVAKLK